ncbi:AzlD domain-containing protein [Pseudomonas sp. FFUP_PS_473]|jgi:branched-subunit amino acid transport protein|uniref:AzlD domain-containing protein n=1 Tax=unclassified Pseudomonas TaxID=196821 RepID=UPI000C19815D|nr:MULTISPECIES: AzlD domain-containing protein [unclassified Pseudomonas]ATR83657.1 branched-chain amino acid ABC transporter [Pseudomonas sp. HLS-6]MEE3635901.1 AzlD domain-containing protein [Pseudomonas sp. AL 58]PLP95156.1 AzlD domain-containing protein [Pseudomonas sp. FFUP_PS_473]WJM95685.1 AzlD domain-containing protein [Pseudomonas defluvii]
MIFLLIVGMGLVVFLNRYAFLEPRLPLRLSSNARQFLGFAVPGMLTAICGPIIFMPDHQLDLNPANPYLVGSMVAVVLVLLTRNTLISMLLSMAFFFVFRWWMNGAA